MKSSTYESGGIGSDAVAAKTGKTWAEWFKILDNVGAKKMTHKEIVAFLVDHHAVGPWWQQMITVGYEQERGLRQKHETASGFSASISRTIHVPLRKLYGAWDSKSRGRWLTRETLTVRKATANKSMRITCGNDGSNIEVNFYAKGPGKSQVVVQQNKLAKADDVRKAKAFWSKSLDNLKELLTD